MHPPAMPASPEEASGQYPQSHALTLVSPEVGRQWDQMVIVGLFQLHYSIQLELLGYRREDKEITSVIHWVISLNGIFQINLGIQIQPFHSSNLVLRIDSVSLGYQNICSGFILNTLAFH